jgi:CO/xanthine dehydrogenase Mo-binding subunit
VAESTTISVGANVQRIDAPGKVTGDTPYPGDLNIDGQLWMKIRFSDRAHARVLHVDTAQAEALPGVVAVFTAKDVPCNEYGLVIKDQPVICGPGSTIPGAEHVRCFMDVVAVVVAETEAIAAQAARLIAIAYEDLPTVFDAREALAPDAPQLLERYPNNTICHYRIRKGDMDRGWAEAAVIVEGEFSTGYQEHAYLQPEAGLGYIDEEGRVTVVVGGQWVHEDQEQIYHALDLPPEQVRVIYPAIGGAFGGREDMSVQIVLALAAWRLRRPIKVQWNREESILYHHKRHPMYLRLKWGARADGTLTAMEATAIGDAGAYNYTSNKVLGNTNLMICGVYVCENIHTDTYGVVTNNIPTGAFRGFGAPQACFAAESMMNRLAERLGMDPIGIRLKNCYREGSILSVGTPLPAGVSMPQVIETAAREGGWTPTNDAWTRSAPAGAAAGLSPLGAPQPAGAPHLRRGIGFACGFKNVGYSFGFPEQCWATIELYGAAHIEEVILKHAAAEVGQGSHTALVQMAAEACGVPLANVRLLAADTAFTQTSGSVSASRMTFMAGNAIRGAAAQALAAWAAEERPARATYQYRPPPTTPYDPQTGKSEPNFAYGYVAQVAEVEVDVETGLIRVLRLISVNDVGKAINPQLVQGQIEGAVAMAIGYTVMEHLISEQGRIRNPYLSTYLIPTVWDMPTEVKSVILEHADPIGPWGARGMAEMPFIPVAPAIAAAVHDATGVWFDDLPLIPDRVVPALRATGLGLD